MKHVCVPLSTAPTHDSSEWSDTSSPPSLTLKISKEQLLSSRPSRRRVRHNNRPSPRPSTSLSWVQKSAILLNLELPTTAQSSHTEEPPAVLASPTSSSFGAPSARPGASSSGGGRLAIKVKLTRSKAWLEEYLVSEDPIKIFLAAVYNYHDPSGEFVAEPFHELPSQKVR